MSREEENETELNGDGRKAAPRKKSGGGCLFFAVLLIAPEYDSTHIDDMQGLLRDLHSKGIYCIARIV